MPSIPASRARKGLDQAFNSLDAQREACAAYILSQSGECWTALPAVYDDGGLSGGTLERPALKRLLADVADGGIDIIVVYKVDRLTRSLFDFAKLVETFDKAGTSFVSVTQAFNTTTSMGRLTLNMLLSFAQFEREVTAERIRDKIAASKAKGMWMGGTPPLGYRPDERTLAIVPEHAALVEHLYRRFLKLGSVRELVDELHAKGTMVPTRTRGNGAAMGGGRWSRGQVNAILHNPIYLGEIHHRGATYPGKHPPLIDRALWDAVRRRFVERRQGTKRAANHPDTSLLAGKVFDEAGVPLIASHASKQGVRYRYYVSRTLHHRLGDTDRQGVRVPARELERAVAERVAEALADPMTLLTDLSAVTPNHFDAVHTRADGLSKRVAGGDSALLVRIVAQVTLIATGMTVTLSGAALADELGTDIDVSKLLSLHCDTQLTRCGRSVRLVHTDGRPPSARVPDLVQIRLIARGRAWWQQLAAGTITPTELAAAEGVTSSYIIRLVRLAFLAPDIVEAVMTGKAAVTLTSAQLTDPVAHAVNWSEQRRLMMATHGNPPVADESQFSGLVRRAKRPRLS